uniref:hypothetical protein n=1 Tax=uncultured Erythrobacter sp. TaxID=263913 RepID=UPI0026220E04|nr:hypothetical protein [uncultured Erythrobacter sp.]
MKFVQGLVGSVLGMSGGLLVLGVFFASPAVSETVQAVTPEAAGEPIVRVEIVRPQGEG